MLHYHYFLVEKAAKDVSLGEMFQADGTQKQI